MSVLLEQAEAMADEIVAIRRDLHQHPELGQDLPRTSRLVMDKLKEYGVDEVLNPVSTAVIGIIHGMKGPGKCVGIRCDMDALPVQEKTGLSFSSENEGVMHACGHDLHTSMMLGNAKLLCQHRDAFAGTVKLIFEPSEEVQPGGARMIIASGAVDDVDVFIGMHVKPSEGDVGKVSLYKGPITTSADEVYITVHGKGGHGSEPDKAADAILAGCQINVLLQQIQARNINPQDTVILTMNQIQGGTAVNIIAETCTLIGGFRTYTPEARETGIRKIHDICRGVEKISDCKIDAQVTIGYDACFNDEATVDVLKDAYDTALGEDSYVMLKEPMKFSEDFSFFSTQTGKPAVLLFLNAGSAPGHEAGVLHSDTCTFDEKAIPHGMAAMCAGALSLLK